MTEGNATANINARSGRRRWNDGFLRFLVWREKHIKEKTFVMLLALVVGILCGTAALVLKSLIHYISHMLTQNMSITGGNYLYFIYPVVGIVIVGIYVRHVVKDNISHGVTRVLYAISQNKSRLKSHNIYTSVVASSVTIGFGGSVGAEGPIVYTGAAIGSRVVTAGIDDSGRMRSRRRHSRYIQSPYRRYAFHS